MLNKKTLFKELLFTFLISTLLLLVCTKSSPLYPMNDWVDVDCIYTMGKAINKGLVVYRDIFDHKGPILYVIFAIADLISSNSFIGLWLFEVLCVAGFLFFTIQSSKLLVENHNVIYFSTPFIALFLLTSQAFTHGGSTEELALLPLSYSFYYFLRLSKNLKIKTFEHFLNGVCFALVFWMKFTMVGLYLGVYLFVAIYVLFKKETRLIVPTLYSAVGFFAVSAVVLMYFAMNNALKDLWEVYFYGNIFTYTDNVSFVEKLGLTAGRLFAVPFINPLLFFPIFFSFVTVIAKRKKNMLPTVVTFFLTFFLLYLGGARNYYPIVLAVYSCVVVWAANEIYEKIKSKKLLLWSIVVSFYAVCLSTADNVVFSLTLGAALICLVLLVKVFNKPGVLRIVPSLLVAVNIVTTFLMSFPMGNNTYLLDYKKEDMPQYKFAEIINEKENATLLNYGFLDGGFYFASGVMPSNKYFYRSNLLTQELIDEQEDIIKNHKVDFVVTRTDNRNQNVIDAGYVQIAHATHVYLGQNVDFFLFQKPD